jgi:hypothetical protein
VGKIYERIDDKLAAWLEGQHVYFVGTAPLGAEDHVNVSPKGGRGSFKVLGPNSVGYLDIAGSGAETIAHLRENGRIVLMFCAFEGRPKIIRLHGRGSVHVIGDPGFDRLARNFSGAGLNPVATRSVIEVSVDRIASSCGYSVPLMSFEGVRPHQDLWAEKTLDRDGPAGIVKYMRSKNLESLDGLPAIDERELPLPTAGE